MRKDWINWLLCLLSGIAMQLLNKICFPIKNILPLEFAKDANEMHSQTMAIANSAAECFYILKFNTLIDCLFLIVYSLLFYFSIKILFTKIKLSLRSWMLVLIVATGFWDLIENYYLVTTAFRQEINFSMVYFWAVRIKWMFAVLPALAVTTTVLLGIYQLIRKLANH